MAFKNICIVLVEPQGGLNLGSVARTMMNFGFSDLRLVRPLVDPEGEDARKMALKALPLLTNAQRHETLGDALADCHFALGTTRRFGKYREDTLHPWSAATELMPLAREKKVGLVFGREDKGLTTAELDLCQRLITIPSSDAFPSLNLAQAVAVCLYELTRHHSTSINRSEGRQSFASLRSLEAMYRQMRETFLRIGFLNPQNPDHILHAFRRIFGRAGLNEREVRILRGLWNRISLVEDERSRLDKGKQSDS